VWFALPLMPVGLLTTMHWPGFGRFLYLPCAGLAIGMCAVASQAWSALPNLRRILAVGLCGYMGILAIILLGVVASYRDKETLYTAAIEGHPDVGFAYAMLGDYFAGDGGDLEKAVALYTLASMKDPTHYPYAKGVV